MVGPASAVDDGGPAEFGCDNDNRIAQDGAQIVAQCRDDGVELAQRTGQSRRLTEIRVPPAQLEHGDSGAVRFGEEVGRQPGVGNRVAAPLPVGPCQYPRIDCRAAESVELRVGRIKCADARQQVVVGLQQL